MLDNLLLVALSSLTSGIVVGTLFGAEIYKRYLTQNLLRQTLES